MNKIEKGRKKEEGREIGREKKKERKTGREQRRKMLWQNCRGRVEQPGSASTTSRKKKGKKTGAYDSIVQTSFARCKFDCRGSKLKLYGYFAVYGSLFWMYNPPSSHARNFKEKKSNGEASTSTLSSPAEHIFCFLSTPALYVGHKTVKFKK